MHQHQAGMLEKKAKPSHVRGQGEIEHQHGWGFGLEAAALVVDTPRVKADPSKSAGQAPAAGDDLEHKRAAEILQVQAFMAKKPRR